MAAIANSREARRRRIMERGSDRLALITGRIQTLPPPSSLPSDSDAHPVSSSTDPNPTAVSPPGETEESDSIMPNHDLVTDPNQSDACKSKSPATSLHKHEDENEISSVPTSEVEHVQPTQGSDLDITGNRQQSQPQTEETKLFTSSEISSAINVSKSTTSEVEHVQPPPDSSLDITGTKQQSQTHNEEPKLFIPSEISSAINASKSIRLCCSVAVALLVVASYLGFSLLGSEFIKSIISFRPLYLVLVTNLTVVVARLLSSRHRGSERSERRQNRTSSDGDHWDTQLAKTLEAGLVMQNMMDAVFMDCAIYAIIVICGLSLVQT